MRQTPKLIAFLCLPAILLASSVGAAPPPRTLNYQGELTTSEGVPVDGERSIAFSLYEVESGGSVLWTETDAVTVVNGRFQTELGDGVAMAEDLFNRQLWLGVTVGTDAEMTPRAKLTAAPVAMRALQVFQNELLVPLESTPQESGLALLAAMAVADAAAGEPFTVRLEPGTYDLGEDVLVLPRNTKLVGGGAAHTLVTSTHGAFTIQLQAGSQLHQLKAVNTAGNVEFLVAAVRVENVGDGLPTGVVIRDAELLADAQGGSTGVRAGIATCVASDLTVQDVHAAAVGGAEALALMEFCGMVEGLTLRDVKLTARDGGVRTVGMAILLQDANVDGLDVDVSASNNPGGAQAVGIQIFQAAAAGTFRDVHMRVATPEGIDFGDGVVIGFWMYEVGDITIEDSSVVIDGYGASVEGISVHSIPGSGSQLLRRVQIDASGKGDNLVAAINSSSSSLSVFDSLLRTVCSVDQVSGCIGVSTVPNADGLMLLDGSTVEVTALHMPASPTPWMYVPLTGNGRVRVQDSTLRQLSGNGTSINMFEGGQPVALEVTQSRLETTITAVDGTNCIFVPPGSEALFTHNTMSGEVCALATCLANTTLANSQQPNSFFANTCPPTL